MTAESVPLRGRVFLSHASEDKGRFVIAFASALRSQGIDVWLDRWEMLPGDSLVDKIFEEGLKEATAIIVVVSKFSIQKPWVREELNAATVKRISNGTKLIPVVIDRCDVPECLKTTIWEQIEDLQHFDEPLHRIVASILGLSLRPALGTPSKGYTTDPSQFPGLTSPDVFLLKAICEHHMNNNSVMIDPGELWDDDDPDRLPLGVHLDSQEHLSRNGLIRLHRTIGPGPYLVSVAPAGLEAFLRTTRADYMRKVREVGLCLINTEARDSNALAKIIDMPIPAINHILRKYESNGHIEVHETLERSVYVWNVSPTLRRAIQ